jgi:hypothetical protein
MGKRAAPTHAVGRAERILPALLAIPHVSEAGLRKIVGQLDDEEPDADHRLFRKHAKKVFDVILDEICVDYVMQFSNGRTDTVPVAKLELVFAWFARECPCFQKLLLRACSQSQQLTLVVYTDEVTPGNALSPDNLRKAYLFYVSVLEFGKALRREAAWFPVALVKHASLDLITGGLSRFCRDVFRIWKASDLFKHGFVMNLCGHARVVKFQALKTVLLVDYAAAAGSWSAKGASGTRPCIGCKNVLLWRSHLEQFANPDGYLVSICCSDPSKFDVMTDEDYKATAAELVRAAALSAAELARVEISAGFKFEPEGLLQANDLTPGFLTPVRTLVDGMHNLYASGGIVNVETGLFVKCLRSAGLELESIQQLVAASWERPFMRKRRSGMDSNPWRVSSLLNDHKLADDHYKGNASELLSLLPALEWVAHSLRPHMPENQKKSTPSFQLAAWDTSTMR